MTINLKQLAMAAAMALVGATAFAAPSSAGSIEVQYRDGDRYERRSDDRRDMRQDRNDRYERRGPPPRFSDDRRDRRDDRRLRLSRHDRACLATYRSYDPRSNLYRDRNGRLRQCRL
ncbi:MULTISPECIES: BA14K family protein [unclassified Aureimonas]|uniref:BA14K family protein n=1 Tax=unclassified Aureimonas TaxID=2615206 RepID=UPI0006F4ECF9|nr:MULTISPECIES: BA14K family protein [unclassified Aureimonas]KQT52472.1 hypothetical protein ASG62_14725 [Aureimonas sp. Leaf427]KQT77627.1 hypothetical protein ASG54_11685 [Aureimonas sp. Leaf460]